MTRPVLTDGGQLCTVTSRAGLLTENAPVTVINQSATSRIYVAASSSVSSVTGVPVEAGTSYDWETTGPLYAILDPGAPDTTAAVVLTNAGGLWSPSPVAIGAAVATELLETGVPIKLVITDLGSYTVGAGAQLQLPVDLSDYATIHATITFAVPSPIPPGPTYQFQVQNGAGATFNVTETDTLQCNGAGVIPGVLIPVLGTHISFGNVLSTSAFTVQLFGYNRAVVDKPTSNGNQSSGFVALAPNMTPPQTAQFSVTPQFGNGFPFQGAGQFTVGFARTSGTGVPTIWQLYYQYPAESQRFTLATNVSATIYTNGAGSVYVFDAALPAAACDLHISFGGASVAGAIYDVTLTGTPK